MVDKLLRRREVEDAVGLKHSEIYKRMSENRFPKPVRLDAKRATVRWLASEIAEYQKSLIAERDNPTVEQPRREPPRKKRDRAEAVVA